MTDYQELQETFKKLGVAFMLYDYDDNGVCGAERFTNERALMPKAVMDTTRFSINITDTSFYFDSAQNYLGLVGAEKGFEENATWESRS